MTALVEMTSRPDDAAKKQSMSFLYLNIQQGTAGKSGSVDVIDVPAQTVVSIGLRGDATSSRVAEAKRRLDKWLQAHAQECTPNGSLQVFAYNSPFVADAKKLAEVQIPIQVKNSVKRCVAAAHLVAMCYRRFWRAESSSALLNMAYRSCLNEPSTVKPNSPPGPSYRSRLRRTRLTSGRRCVTPWPPPTMNRPGTR